MIYLTQLIYLVEGAEAVFDEFEEVAMPTIPRYGGQLLLRVRPGPGAVIAGGMESPYEIHLVQFDRQEDFDGFMRDDERKQFLHLKERSIQASLLIRGEKL